MVNKRMNDADGNQVRLSPAMLFITMLTVLYGMVFLIPPWDTVERCGPSTYWSVIIAFIYMLPFVLVLVALQRRFPDQNIFEAAFVVFGKVAGRIINLLYLVFFLFHYGLLIRGSAELVSTYFLDRTPLWVLLTLFLASIGYIAYDGLFSISRLAGFVAIPAISLRILIQLFAMQGLQPTQLQPVFSASLPDYLTAGISMLSPFSPLIGLLILYPLLKKPGKLGFLTLGLVTGNVFLLLITVISTVGVLGPPMIAALEWPIFEVIRRVALPYLVLEQTGPLYIIVWLTLFMVGAAFMFYFFGYGLHCQFPKLKYRLFLIGILLIVLVEGILIPTNFVNLSIFSGTRNWAIFLVLGYPLLVYGGALIRGKRGRET